MRPARREKAGAARGLLRREHASNQSMTCRQKLNRVRSFFKILWWQGIRPPYRLQFWTQLIGMLRKNPSRVKQYLVTCVEGEDLFDIRQIVRDKVAAIIKERNLKVPAAKSWGRAAAR